jgi:hypothetical protein
MRLGFAAVLGLSLLAGLGAILSAAGLDPDRPPPADFNIFMLAGRLAAEGRLAEAYLTTSLKPLETMLRGHAGGFIPFSYPPAFGFIIEPLALLPLALAYLVFVGGTLWLYLGAMLRLGRAQAWPVLLCLLPAMLINIRSGQNGLLTGGLLAVAMLDLSAKKPLRGGLVLACLAIKPHLALGLPLPLLLQRRWRLTGAAATGALLLTGLSVLVYGAAVFTAFLGGLAEAGHYMAEGAYPLARMVTLYACLASLGLPHGPALALHGLAAAVILAGSGQAIRRSDDRRGALGLGLMASLFVSPYLYDYDLTIFGVGLMLAAPGLLRRLSPRHYGLLLLGVALSQSFGLPLAALGLKLSLAAPLLVVLQTVMILVVGRNDARDAASPLSTGGQVV